MRRKSLGKKTRFEVFKRDSFTCQYCGGKAPDVVLHVDHIRPVADGGSNDIVNLATACVACNLGKGARGLGDHAVAQKQQAQLEELQSRREQLEMMVEWQKGLMNLERDTVDMVDDFWASLQPGGSYGLNDYGRGELKKWIQRHPVDEVMSAMREAAAKIKVQDDGTTERESVCVAFHLVPKLLRVMTETKKEPFAREAYYVRGILRRRFAGDVVDWEAKALLLDALNGGSSPDRERDWARRARSYWAWERQMHSDAAERKAGS